MAREPKTTQDDPTAPRPTDEAGRVLDGWGLPVNGPARAAALAEAGKPDPLEDPSAWGRPATSAPTVTPPAGQQD